MTDPRRTDSDMKPEDTTTRDPFQHLVGMMGGTDEYITGMEVAGQAQLVHSDRMPSDIQDRDKMEALGFVFGEPDPDDPMFMPATLPEGWAREGSDHAMWSHIVDERGIERVSMFYKAAFYDRSAHAGLVNVGGAVARKWIYADNPPSHIDVSMLTDDEIQDVVSGLRGYVESAETHPDIYENGDRVKAELALFAGR